MANGVFIVKNKKDEKFPLKKDGEKGSWKGPNLDNYKAQHKAAIEATGDAVWLQAFLSAKTMTEARAIRSGKKKK